MKSAPNFRKFLCEAMISIYQETKDKTIFDSIQKFSVHDWVMIADSYPEFAHLPNYIIAHEILNSPLHKTLEENEQLTNSPQKTGTKKETGT